MSTTVSGAPSSKARVVLTLDDILSDLEKTPLQAEAEQPSSSTLHKRQPLPESSESVETSIELSQRFIESSKRVLKDTEALDVVRAGLDKVDHLLAEVDQGVRS